MIDTASFWSQGYTAIGSLFGSAAGFGFAQCYAMKRCANPRTALQNHFPPPSHASTLFSALVGVFFYCFGLLATGRPLLACLFALSIALLLVFVNQSKERELHEPLVMADIVLLRQVFKYPHLYFPFLPMKKVLLVIVSIILCAVILFWLIPAWSWAWSGSGFMSLCAVIIFCMGSVFLMNQGRLAPLATWLLTLFPVTCEPSDDARTIGPLTAAVIHLVDAGRLRREYPDFLHVYTRQPKESQLPVDVPCLAAQSSSESPHIVLVQAESFCDVGKLWPHLPLQGFTPHWDRLKAQGRAFEPPTNVFGAYTMRAEFHTLTGLSPEVLGPLRFNPFITAARQPFWSLARYYASLGYETICLHPYAKDFFRRDLVVPNLGFSQFIGLEECADLPVFGRYTSDIALAQKIRKILDTSPKPVFCFAITMETHGPWLDGRLTSAEMAATLKDTALESTFVPLDKKQYLCHLRNADTALGLMEAGTSTSSACVVIAYGDHKPNLQN